MDDLEGIQAPSLAYLCHKLAVFQTALFPSATGSDLKKKLRNAIISKMHVLHYHEMPQNMSKALKT